jgi:hypothetical protein
LKSSIFLIGLLFLFAFYDRLICNIFHAGL